MREITVTSDQIYTVRWAINNERPEHALGVLAEMLGEDRPDELPADIRPRPERIRVALVVGHNARFQGAGAGGVMENISEFKFNNLVADYMIGVSPPGFVLRKFFRRFEGSYSREIRAAYHKVDLWRPDLALELHFNGGGGDYTFNLAARNAPTAQSIARAFSKVFANGLHIEDKGVKICGKNDRGGGSLYAIGAPTIISEPFFGDNPDHQEKIFNLGIAGISALYLEGLAASRHLL